MVKDFLLKTLWIVFFPAIAIFFMFYGMYLNYSYDKVIEMRPIYAVEHGLQQEEMYLI